MRKHIFNFQLSWGFVGNPVELFSNGFFDRKYSIFNEWFMETANHSIPRISDCFSQNFLSNYYCLFKLSVFNYICIVNWQRSSHILLLLLGFIDVSFCYLIKISIFYKWLFYLLDHLFRDLRGFRLRFIIWSPLFYLVFWWERFLSDFVHIK
jgi:hypothetical protein